jgi:DNA modification methylase
MPELDPNCSLTARVDFATSPSLASTPVNSETVARKASPILVPIGSVNGNPRNTRKHSKKQVSKVAASIQEFGFVNPIVLDENNVVLVGHCRLEAAKLLGLEAIPAIRLDYLTEEQKRAYMLADNRLAEDAIWDLEKLAVELKELSEVKLDFTIESTGFETVEIDRILEKDEVARASASEAVPEPDPQQSRVSCLGDLWQLGEHRLLCADATREDSFLCLMGDDCAQMVITDLPYNLTISSIVGSGAIQHGEFPMASGEMTGPEFTAFLQGVFERLVRFSIDGSIHFLFMDWRHDVELRRGAEGVYSEYKNLCVWNKANAGLGSFYRSKHELIFVFKSGTAPHINNFGLGGDGRYRTNVWDYPGVNIRRPGGRTDLEMHPTAKPVAMIIDAIKDCSRGKGIILDPFSGSGTTIIACQRTRRVARAMELDPAYVDLAVRRWEALTGKLALHEESGLTLDELAATRGVPMPHYAFERR